MITKMSKPMICYCVVWICILLACLLLIISGKVTLFISNFALDRNDRLYIGAENGICIYEDGKCVGNINPPTSRSYAFTITENDEILLSTASNVYLMDLSGNIIDTWIDHGADTYNQLQYRKKSFDSANNDRYQLVGALGWTSISKNGTETIYRITKLSFVVKIMLIMLWLHVIIIPACIIVKVLKTKKKTGDGSLVS